MTKRQVQTIKKLKGLFPGAVSVETERLKDGGFFAEIKDFPGLFTEANTFSELIEMVNDAVRTYLEIPKEFLAYMPTYLPSVEAAKKLDVFPGRTRNEILLKLPSVGEKVAR